MSKDLLQLFFCKVIINFLDEEGSVKKKLKELDYTLLFNCKVKKVKRDSKSSRSYRNDQSNSNKNSNHLNSSSQAMLICCDR